MKGSTRIGANVFGRLIRTAEALGLQSPHNCAVPVIMRSVAVSLLALLGASAAGVGLCLMKGEGGGLAMAVGNLVAPYFIVAICAGLTSRRWWLAAVLGVIATEFTVAGFYGTWSVYVGHEVSQFAVMLWGGAGVLSGLIFGVVGCAARSRRPLRYVFPALLFLEPAVTQLALLITSRFGIGYPPHLDPRDLFAYAIEVACGLALVLVVRRHLLGQRSRNTALISG